MEQLTLSVNLLSWVVALLGVCLLVLVLAYRRFVASTSVRFETIAEALVARGIAEERAHCADIQDDRSDVARSGVVAPATPVAAEV